MLPVAGLQRAAAVPALAAAAAAAPLPPATALRRRRCPSAAARPARRSSDVARASADEGGPTPHQPLAQENPALAVERQEERALAYGALSGLLGAAGLALAAAPARVVEYLWAATPTIVVSGLAQNVGSQLLLAAIVAHCLKQAAEADHLRSDTYKRLNLALMWWGAGAAAAFWLAPQQPLRLALGLITALLGATAAHAALTYQETDERGLSPPYLLRQFLSSVGNLSSYTNGPGTAIYALYAYGLAAKAMVASTAAILLHGNLKLMQDGLMTAPLGTLGASLLPVTGMGYALGSVVLYTLKDAAKRGRLGASTFKALNIGVATLCLSLAVRQAAWMKAGVMVQTRAAAIKVALPAFLALFCLYQYMFAKKK